MNELSILSQLHILADPTRLEHMQRFGINTTNALGISIYQLRNVDKKY